MALLQSLGVDGLWTCAQVTLILVDSVGGRGNLENPGNLLEGQGYMTFLHYFIAYLFTGMYLGLLCNYAAPIPCGHLATKLVTHSSTSCNILLINKINVEPCHQLYGHPITQTAAKSPAKIYYRRLTEIHSRYKGLWLLRILTHVPARVSVIKQVDYNRIMNSFYGTYLSLIGTNTKSFSNISTFLVHVFTWECIRSGGLETEYIQVKTRLIQFATFL